MRDDLKLIVAVDEDGAIGCENKLLYRAKEDMTRFRELTTNNVVVMGYNTQQSIPNHKLPNRINIVLTTKHLISTDEELIYVKSIEELFGVIDGIKDKDIFVIGGASVYKQLSQYCDTMYITELEYSFKDADTFFELDNEDYKWRLTDYITENDDGEPLMYKGNRFSFLVYERSISANTNISMAMRSPT